MRFDSDFLNDVHCGIGPKLFFLFMLWFKFYNLKYDIQLQSANLFGKF